MNPRLVVAAWLVVSVACRRAEVPASASAGVAGAPSLAGPADSLIPAGPMGASIRRGQALLRATRDSLPAHVGNDLSCTNCHLDDGRRKSGSWVGVHAYYPQYRPRSHTVETIQYRINDCFKRSMNGRPLDPEGADMRDMMAYFAFLSHGVPVGPPPPRPPAPWARFTSDTAAGGRVYQARCVACHGPDGGGTPAGPPVWGPRSYNIGAGMARVFTAASFIKANMPFDQPGSLSDQESLDVAAYINAHPRPDFAGKEHDWPAGGAPPDVAYPVRSQRTSN